MSSKQNWNNTGEQIKDALSDALRTKDFKELNNLLSDTAVSALNEVGKKIEQQLGGGSAGQDNNASQDTPTWQQRMQEREQQKQKQQQEWQAWQRAQAAKQQAWAAQQALARQQAWAAQHQMQTRQQAQTAQQAQQTAPKGPLIKFKKIGNVSNVLYKVFGGIGLGITGLITFIRTLVFLVSPTDTTVGGWIANLIFLAIFFGMIHIGIGQGRRLKRAQRYIQLCDYRVYGEIEHLAKATGKSSDYVVKDLQKMLRLGIFPEGHLDEQNTCFMLNDVVYRQYLETEQNRRIREQESKMAANLQGNSPTSEAQTAPEVSAGQQTELDAMVTEGMDCIRKLRDLNDKIPGEVISTKLFHLENLLKDIFESVKEHPEQMNRMHKLMNYYLPTTLKLVEAYEEFDKVSTPGQEIIDAKAEIENTLDTINQAFTELLNNLFQNAVFDATTDAQVLKTMLAREGLMKDMEFATLGRDS